MKNENDKHLQGLIDHIMSESELESPSIDFTAKVMSEVLSAEKSKTLVYKPVISKRAWVIIFAGVIALFAFLLFNTKSEASDFNFDFSILSFDKLFNLFPGLHLSPMTANVLLAATIMLFVQIFLLKNHFNKKFEK